MEKKRLFSGVQPSGRITLGNYLGALSNWTTLQIITTVFFDCGYACYYRSANTERTERKCLAIGTIPCNQYQSAKKYHFCTIPCTGTRRIELVLST